MNTINNNLDLFDIHGKKNNQSSTSQDSTIKGNKREIILKRAISDIDINSIDSLNLTYKSLECEGINIAPLKSLINLHAVNGFFEKNPQLLNEANQLRIESVKQIESLLKNTP